MGARHPAWLAVLLFCAAFTGSAVLGWHLAERRAGLPPPPQSDWWQLRLPPR